MRKLARRGAPVLPAILLIGWASLRLSAAPPQSVRPAVPEQISEAPADAAHDFTVSTIVIAPRATPGDELAAQVLKEEMQARTGLDWPIATAWPAAGAVVAIAGRSTAWPEINRPDLPEAAARPEGFRLLSERQGDRAVAWILGADRRGALFGVGALVRTLSWGRGWTRLAEAVDLATSPRYPIRGHQLGYRSTSNTYDGWTPAQYERYIRDLVLLGANAVENIPFQDTKQSPLMTVSRTEMNRRVSAICVKYDLQYWLWMPADFSLADVDKRSAALRRMEALFAESPRIDAVFVPGGDPGDNPAGLVLPYLQDIASRLRAHHPHATVWLSLQKFSAGDVDAVFAWIDRERPDWLGGLIAGPGSYPLQEIRARLDRRYRVRDYPDIAHTVRCQYPVPQWDPAFALTLGREPVNPRLLFYARVHDRIAPESDGFITYSDGVTDDANKALWTRKGWDPSLDPRAIALQYARTFFGSRVAEQAADGLLALEQNWNGPLAENGSVDATLALWRDLEAAAPELSGSWRWQMYVMRAYYDAYVRQRLIAETALERRANDALAEAPRTGSSPAMTRATAILDRAVTGRCCAAWRARIEGLCERLFSTIRLQTSVPKYGASGYERGAVLDFLDHPLNNRWWLEDEVAKVRAMPNERARLARLQVLRTWAEPGDGSSYDDVGNIAASPHVTPARVATADEDEMVPHFTWTGGPTRIRLSWLTSLRWPTMSYEHLDASARYQVQLHVIADRRAGTAKLRIDGVPAAPNAPAVNIGDRLVYDVPASAIADGRVVLTFDPIDESCVNWRQYSRLVEAWLIRTPAVATATEAR
jgi:hypothetical protein